MNEEQYENEIKNEIFPGEKLAVSINLVATKKP